MRMMQVDSIVRKTPPDRLIHSECYSAPNYSLNLKREGFNSFNYVVFQLKFIIERDHYPITS